MATLTLRTVKGSPLTNAEVDANFTNLVVAIGGTGLSPYTIPTPTGTGSPVLSAAPTITGHPTIEGITSTGATGTGNFVFATSPTLTTPVLGVATATSINKVAFTTPATGSTLTIADGKTLTVSNTLTFTGTDASSVAFGTGGTVMYSGGALGTPTSGTLTNCTSLPISTGVSGLGTGVATFLATPTSANLIAAVTNETGSGSLVFGTSPALTTPTITGTRETRVDMSALTAIDLATGNYFFKTISTTTTFTISNVPTSGTAVSFILDLTNGGSSAITWFATIPTNLKWVGGVVPTLTAAGRDVLGFFTHDGGTTWIGLVLGKDIK